VGAVIVCRNQVIARSHNMTEELNDVTAHAEMLAITAAENYLGSKYLDECALFVTLEPCVMCASASQWAKLGRLVYGASDPKAGYSLTSTGILHPKTVLSNGLLGDQCGDLLSAFFRKKRH
ncbi:MAG TPA: nucleoside deaminase, partial [Bacteroidales bacterium]|nr:nucleoside deaminase [Bacteroidales bacterium]